MTDNNTLTLQTERGTMGKFRDYIFSVPAYETGQIPLSETSSLTHTHISLSLSWSYNKTKEQWREQIFDLDGATVGFTLHTVKQSEQHFHCILLSHIRLTAEAAMGVMQVQQTQHASRLS